MNSFKEKISQQNVFILLILGVMIVFIGTVLLLYMIWKPEETSSVDDPDKEIVNVLDNKYNYTSYSNEDVISKYFKEFSMLLLNSDKDGIYEFTSKEFLRGNNLDKDSLFSYLENKSFIRSKITATEYIALEHNYYGKVFEVTFLTSSNVTDKVLFIEESPNNYKVSFDNYIGTRKTNKAIIINGVKLTLNEIIEYSTRLYITISFENVGVKDILLNSEHKYENVYLTFTKSETDRIRSLTSWFSGNEMRLKPGQKTQSQLMYEITPLSSGVLNSIVLYDVYNDASKETQELEFKIFK